MNAKLQKTFDRLELQRHQLLSDVGAMSHEEFSTAPPGKWTVNQILAHLIAGEQLTLTYMQKKILGVKDAADSGLYEEVKMLMLKISQRMPGLKFKAPHVVKEHTKVYDSFQALVEDWNRLRSEWRQFLDDLPDEYVNRKIYKHVIAGRLNAHHSLIFAGEHIVHHWPQIIALQKRSSSS